MHDEFLVRARPDADQQKKSLSISSRFVWTRADESSLLSSRRSLVSQFES